MLKWNNVCVCVCVCVWWGCGMCVPSHVQLFVTPHAVSCQALCPWNFPGNNTGIGFRFLLQGNFLIQRLNPCLLHLLKGQANSLPPMPLGKPPNDIGCDINHSIPWNKTNILVTWCCITKPKSKGLTIIIVVLLLSLRVLRVDSAARQFSLRCLPSELRPGSAGVSHPRVAGAWQGDSEPCWLERLVHPAHLSLTLRSLQQGNLRVEGRLPCWFRPQSAFYRNVYRVF